jgi:hypothetical protein
MHGLVRRITKIERQRGERWRVFTAPFDQRTHQQVEWYTRRGYSVALLCWGDEDVPDWFTPDATVDLTFGDD